MFITRRIKMDYDLRNRYTVLLLYPDYIASDFGHETYMAWVEAVDITNAIKAAQHEAMRDSGYYTDPGKDDFLDDFYPLAVFKGYNKDFKPI
jgi:hypothetical protein